MGVNAWKGEERPDAELYHSPLQRYLYQNGSTKRHFVWMSRLLLDCKQYYLLKRNKLGR
jgi:hypothetical protein